MQTIGSDTLKSLESGQYMDVRIRAEGLHGDVTILADDLVAGSFSIDRNSVSGSIIEIGNSETSELKLELLNYDHRWDTFKFEGAVLTVDILVNNEYIRAGKFTVDKRPNTFGTVKIQALDYMAKFNQSYSTTLVNGATLYEILHDCCAQCGVSLYNTSIVNGNVPCLIPSETTFHEVVSMVAELSASNAWIDWNGELRLSWYLEADFKIDEYRRFSFDMAENDILITGVTYKTKDNDYLIGTDNYAIVIESNDLVDDTQVTTLLNGIYGVINGFIYRPFSFDTPSYPHLWPLDKIIVTDSSGVEYSSIITNHAITLNGLSKISAKGESNETYSYASAAPFTARQKKVLNKVIDLRAGQQITALDQAMIQLNELAANAQGFYQTVVTDPVTQARIDYMHNQPLLANSTIVYKRTSDGFFWTDNYQGESTVWTSGYTASGNIVAKTLSVVGINADWISTGSITGQKLADGTIGDVKIATGLNASKITTGSLTSSNFSGTGDGSTFATNGMKINTLDGTIGAKNWRVDSNGKVVIKNILDVYNGVIVRGPSSTITYYIDGTSGMMNVSCGPYGTQDRVGLYVEGTSYFDDKVLMESDCEIDNNVYPSGNNTSLCGTDSNPWSDGWFRQLHVKDDAWADHWYTNSSDIRLKKDVEPIQNGVDLILNLDPVQYKLIDGESGRTHYGFIAQQVKEAMTKSNIDDCALYADRSLKINPETGVPDNIYLTLDYMQFISPMVQTIQHLEKRIAELEARLGG